MKKTVLLILVMLLVHSNAYAQKSSKKTESNTQNICIYTPMQKLVRDARNADQIFQLIKDEYQLQDDTITCGGSLVQLAVRRGIPQILYAIGVQDNERLNQDVSLQGFSIPGAPDKIPVVLFAAYYAPSVEMFKVFLDLKADITKRDSLGHDILWYLYKNPLLRQTELEDKIRFMLPTLSFEELQKRMQVAKPVPMQKLDGKVDIETEKKADFEQQIQGSTLSL
jgi:hypothetical protein